MCRLFYLYEQIWSTQVSQPFPMCQISARCQRCEHEQGKVLYFPEVSTLVEKTHINYHSNATQQFQYKYREWWHLTFVETSSANPYPILLSI